MVSAICGSPVGPLSVLEAFVDLGGVDVTPADPSQVKLFSLDAEQLIQSSENALVAVQISENDGDAVNGVRSQTFHSVRLRTYSQISISTNQKSLAFTLDSGVVGVVDLLKNSVRMMKTPHSSVSIDMSVSATSKH